MSQAFIKNKREQKSIQFYIVWSVHIYIVYTFQNSTKYFLKRFGLTVKLLYNAIIIVNILAYIYNVGTTFVQTCTFISIQDMSLTIEHCYL